ncbi:MAG: HAD-IIB family hydrolase [Firmicutes bacterium]|nr:HAD-IIB family hydrolase [Bacillota bacterium]
MNLAQYRLIVTDLDGTLVKPGTDELAPAVRAAVLKLKGRGIYFTIATGRDWRHTRGIARELEVFAPVILQAGGIVIDPVKEKALRVQPVRPEIENQLRKYLVSHRSDLETADHFCLNETGQYFGGKIKTLSGKWLLNKMDYRITVDPASAPAPALKHLFIGPERQLKRLAMDFSREIHPAPNTILWPSDPGTKDWFLEVFDPAASKGQAVKWLADSLKIKRRQVLAFGDGVNDIDLLKWAGCGVAVEGSLPEVAAAADCLVPGPESDGVARFLLDSLEGPCLDCG